MLNDKSKLPKWLYYYIPIISYITVPGVYLECTLSDAHPVKLFSRCIVFALWLIVAIVFFQKMVKAYKSEISKKININNLHDDINFVKTTCCNVFFLPNDMVFSKWFRMFYYSGFVALWLSGGLSFIINIINIRN